MIEQVTITFATFLSKSVKNIKIKSSMPLLQNI